MNQRVYIAAYHQSRFGKLMNQSVPEIVSNAVQGVCKEIGVEPRVADVGSIGSACNFTLNEQGLLSGLMAMVPAMAGGMLATFVYALTSDSIFGLTMGPLWMP